MKNQRSKVCILSSVHNLFDTRIFHKQAKSLLKAGFKVSYVVQAEQHMIIDGISIIPLKKPKNRLWRMVLTSIELYIKALKERADIYHFHDPELIPIGILLKLAGKKVVY